ncbi:MAG: hypothetical protein ACE5HC_15745 [Candidatus Binatia bacterium]
MTKLVRKTLFRILTLQLGLGFAFVGASLALAQSVPMPLKTATDRQLGTFLVDPKGMTLYLFDNDKVPGKSNCYGGCAETWPPFVPKRGDPTPVAPLTIIIRTDGSKQYAYKGRPLYTYVEDASVGSTEGQGLGDRWWVVKP